MNRNTIRSVASDGKQLEPHRRYLWGLAYRITGSAADADEIVQDCFVRAVEQQPDARQSLRPWLRTVTANLAKDRLRRRKSAPYVGTWLPQPILTDAWQDDFPETRYLTKETLTFAFLGALERLTETQRVVLVLRDVYDLSARETAAALSLSEPNVRVILHRARKLLSAYELHAPPSAECIAATQSTLARLLGALAQSDLEAVKAALSTEAEAVTDANGEFTANRKILMGPDRIATFFHRIRPDDTVIEPRLAEVNGLPALLYSLGANDKPTRAPRGMISISLNRQGKIQRIDTVLATPKLARVFDLDSGSRDT